VFRRYRRNLRAETGAGALGGARLRLCAEGSALLRGDDMTDKRCYLDYNATTPICEEALEAFAQASRIPGNPSSVHLDGQSARHCLDAARQELASVFGVQPQEIIFTSGATEANNLAIKGIARHAKANHKKNHLLISAIEHPSVLDAATALKAEGFEVEEFPVLANGRADATALESRLRPETALVALMRVNNETGIVQPTAEAAGICSKAGVPLHVDWVQGLGKLPVDLAGAASASFSAHKAYGPKGVGALVTARSTRLLAQAHGGPQENNLRAGTESPALASAFAASVRTAERLRAEGAGRMMELRQVFLKTLESCVRGWGINGDPEQALPQTVSLRVDGVDGSVLVRALDLAGVSVSSGSACAAGSIEPSYVLEAMGLDPAAVRSSVRVSFGHFTQSDELIACAQILGREAARLKTASGSRS
jgi:cysteine desulfurase